MFITVSYATFAADILDKALTVANVHWKIATTRDEATATITLKYTAAEITSVLNEYSDKTSTLDESSLVIYYDSNEDDTYYPLPTTRDRERNILSAVVEDSSLPASFVVGGWEAPIGKIPEVSVNEENGKWSFAIWGDPQIVDASSSLAYNAWNPRLVQTIALTNDLDASFVVTLGDNVHASSWDGFKAFYDTVTGQASYPGVDAATLERPLFCLMGNHEHHHDLTAYGYGNFYSSDANEDCPYQYHEYSNFLCFQEQLNEFMEEELSSTDVVPRKATYSFDAGDWHFILFSQPGDRAEGINDHLSVDHPEWLDWLKADLVTHSASPTMFFTHHPLLPFGRLQKSGYGPNGTNRQKMMDILTNYGDVRYAFFGHVHNPVSSLPLVSWNYQGTSFIILPNAAYGFQNWYFHENYRSAWGPAIVHINGATVDSIEFRTVELGDTGTNPDTTDDHTLEDTSKYWDDERHKWRHFGAEVKVKPQGQGWQAARLIVDNTQTTLTVSGSALPATIEEYEIFVETINDSTSGSNASRTGDYSLSVASASWEANIWRDGILTAGGEERLVAGNSIDSVTIYGHRGALPSSISSFELSRRNDHMVGDVVLYSATRDPTDFFATYDDDVYGYLFPYWDMPGSTQTVFRNGDFNDTGNLTLARDDVKPEDWYVNHLIHYATPPLQRRTIEDATPGAGSNKCLHLYGEAESVINKQAKTNHIWSEARQAFSKSVLDSTLSVDYLMAATEFVNPLRGFPFVVVAGHEEGLDGARFSVMYRFGTLQDPQRDNWVIDPCYFPKTARQINRDVAVTVDGTWQQNLKFNVAQDYVDYDGQDKWGLTWEEMKTVVDTVVVHVGVFVYNYYETDDPVAVAPRTGVHFDRITWE